jgi:Mannosyltransferase (PIG-V)).
MTDDHISPLRLDSADVWYCLVLVALALLVYFLAKGQAVPMWGDKVTFDGSYYLDIAMHGYAFNGDIESKQNISFLPLQAAIMAATDALLPGHNHALKMALTGAVVMFGTLLGFFALIPAFSSRQAARLAALVWALGPLAFYTFVGYTEPLFALATIWCLVALHRHWMWTASLIVGAAVLGRPQAVILGLLVGVELLRQAQWRPWRLLDGTAVFKMVVMAAPLMAFASWQAWRFGDSMVYTNSLEAWRLGSFDDGMLSFFPALHYFFEALTTQPPQLTAWVVMLGGLTLLLVSTTFAFSTVLPARVLALYVGLLAFLAVFVSFDAANVARHVSFMVPWAIAIGSGIAMIDGRERNKYLAMLPLLAFFVTINVLAVMRYYRGEWVS